ncbi:MAG TPA: 4-hydroxy-tetrahydrodipicolinate synthase [Gammaproteobacteria bacterium]|jgi:4-hydroxy-tetrahydrodipicolinate synthase|nr:4-hydroxy-tetrahydrodipicolinate synthase [Arenicellales bacterium]MDP6854080.1 4-hydroxy-tetrahydrodipicolinate synthase [Arenicellales bacterium]MDP6947449.1 4-hydroxy-tetrahydrodipicolinate synthase [Arenicellales bacterium]HCY13212.1 4-hydroxy-tetrahydrodipicolinate synthase [Gammaproteobacteria bacterium]|tara:strand:+ start:1735 stop:2610 length:876 start_codon:yes stop_codon:yes gene_type:complete
MLTGSMVAMVTPMNEDGSVDWPALERLVDHHLEQGTDAIVSVGTTGESATLDHDEHGEVIAKTVQAVNGRIPVIGGTGANSTAEAISLTRRAAAAGVDACLLVVPYYNKPPQEGLYQHFKAVAEAVAIPQILYNVPGRTALDMHNDTTLRLTAIDNIVGIKDATNDLDRGRDLIARCPGDFAIYSGEDGTACQLMLAGGKGTISVTANAAPELMHQMCTAAVAGDTDEALALNERLSDLHVAMFLESNPIPAKWAVQQQGYIGGGIRLPLVPLSAQHQAAVRAAMVKVGVL